MKTIIIIFGIAAFIALIFFLNYLSTMKNHAKEAQEMEQKKVEYLQKWYSQNNPNNDPKGRQPSEEDLDDITLASFGGKNYEPKKYNNEKVETIVNKDSLDDLNIKYTSSKYGYSIGIPKTFRKTKGNRPHIDLKFVDDFGAYITVTVKAIPKSEPRESVHDYSKEMLENSFKQSYPNMKITFTEKIFLSGEKAFMIEDENIIPNMKSMECFLSHKDFVFIISESSEESRFPVYRNLFRRSIESLNF